MSANLSNESATTLQSFSKNRAAVRGGARDSGSAVQIPSQGTMGGWPAFAVMDGMLLMAYSGQNDDSRNFLFTATSTDGLNWTDPVEMPGECAGTPALVTFQGQFLMAWADNATTGNQINTICSPDGVTWSSPAPVADAFTGTPALTVLGNTLYMVFTGSSNSDLYVTSTNDGVTWAEPAPIRGQSTSIAAIAAFNGALWMVYSDSDNSQLWVTNSTDGVHWMTAEQISGQGTSVPALAVFNNQLWMVYSDAHSSQLWVSTSSDGWDWQNQQQQPGAQQIPGQTTNSTPALASLGGYLCMVYPDSSPNSEGWYQLWASRSQDGWDWQAD